MEVPSEAEANISVGLDGGHSRNPNYTIQLSSATYSTQFSLQATELRIFSQHPGPASWQQYESYVHETGRMQTYIYHVELGLNPHPLDVQKIAHRMAIYSRSVFLGPSRPKRNVCTRLILSAIIVLVPYPKPLGRSKGPPKKQNWLLLRCLFTRNPL